MYPSITPMGSPAPVNHQKSWFVDDVQLMSMYRHHTNLPPYNNALPTEPAGNITPLCISLPYIQELWRSSTWHMSNPVTWSSVCTATSRFSDSFKWKPTFPDIPLLPRADAATSYDTSTLHCITIVLSIYLKLYKNDSKWNAAQIYSEHDERGNCSLLIGVLLPKLIAKCAIENQRRNSRRENRHHFR